MAGTGGGLRRCGSGVCRDIDAVAFAGELCSLASVSGLHCVWSRKSPLMGCSVWRVGFLCLFSFRKNPRLETGAVQVIPGNLQKYVSTNRTLLQCETLPAHFSNNMMVYCLLNVI